jgi:N-acetylneuraminate lyase
MPDQPTRRGQMDQRPPTTMYGIVPALLTAYDDDGALDYERTGALITSLLDAGVHGFFVSGSTGESLLHTVGERKKLLEFAQATIGARGFLIAHVGALDTATTLELACFASDLGVTAVSAITPLYYALSPDAHAAYFRRIAEVVDVPVIAYHIPGRSGVDLPASWFVDLAAEGVLHGVKYTSTDLHTLHEIRRRTPREFTVFNGSDEVLLGGLALGADGGIGSTYTVMPRVYLDLYQAFRAGEWDAARSHQAVASHVIQRMSAYNFLAFLREVLNAKGCPMGDSREPLPALNDSERAALTRLLATDGTLRAAVGLPAAAPLQAADRP